jgi:ADP-ribose pyrophosphatase
VLLVRQYRYATGGWLLEIPAGKLDRGESPETCAGREAEEEVGYRPGKLEPLGWIWSSPGFADEKIWLFLATGLEEAKQELEHDEILHVERMSFQEAVEKAARGEIHDAKSAVALLRAGRVYRPKA